MRLLLVILVVLSQSLTAFGRCETVWHDAENDGVAAHHIHDRAGTDHDHDHNHDHNHDHPTFALRLPASEHDQGAETPSHSHVLESKMTAKVRSQSPRIELPAPLLCLDLTWVASLQTEPGVAVLIADEPVAPPRRPPLAGRTSNLLF